MSILPVLLDLAAVPVTYDVMNALVIARMAALRKGHAGFHVTFVAQDFRQRTPKDDALTVEEKRWRVEHIHIPLALRTEGCVGVEIVWSREAVRSAADAFTPSFMLQVLWPLRPTAAELRAFRPSPDALRRTRAWLANSGIARPVPMTLRRSHVEPARNSDPELWTEAARTIAEMGYGPVIIPDHDVVTDGMDVASDIPLYSPGALDVDLRLALYALAEVNLSDGGGPGFLPFFMGAPTVSFLPVNAVPTLAGSLDGIAWFLGVPAGGQFPTGTPSQRLVWEASSPTVIVDAFDSVRRGNRA